MKFFRFYFFRLSDSCDVNLDNVRYKDFKKVLKKIKTSKGIIFDLRGYPAGGVRPLMHLIKEKINQKNDKWMFIPNIYYPNQLISNDSSINYSSYGWTLKPKKPYLGNKKISFLTNGTAISYAESYLSFVEYYKIGVIIGESTAGTNGNINLAHLPGGYMFFFTGMKVLKHDGTQHHGVGIQPTISCKRTIEGIRQGKDEVLERAIEYINTGK